MRWEVRSYARPLRRPLQTAHGAWSTRTGLILRFTDVEGRVSFGEIAPLPWFGTETLAAATAWCDRGAIAGSPEQSLSIPDTLPACQFGFAAGQRLARAGESAPGRTSAQQPTPAEVCALLPAGATALTTWEQLWQQGHRTFKWKIGVAPVPQEVSIFRALVQALPPAARLRLDANGGLTAAAATTWLTACDSVSKSIEFLEQPLPPATLLDWLPTIREQFQTAIALDESVATLAQLRQVYKQVGNQVVYGLKPAIAGHPDPLFDFCVQRRLDVVISSALETPVGRNAVLKLARNLWAAGIPKRALGVGVDHWFADDWAQLSEETVWTRL